MSFGSNNEPSYDNSKDEHLCKKQLNIKKRLEAYAVKEIDKSPRNTSILHQRIASSDAENSSHNPGSTKFTPRLRQGRAIENFGRVRRGCVLKTHRPSVPIKRENLQSGGQITTLEADSPLVAMANKTLHNMLN